MEFAEPNFKLYPKKRFEPLFYQQWNFYNIGQFDSKPDIDINAYEAWQYSLGNGVKVAIIDDGFDVGHEDLLFVDTYNALDESKNVAADAQNFHGTLCAGLVGAKINEKGIVGVAPQSRLVGIKLVEENRGLYVGDIVRAFLYAKDADIISCSWGTYDVADAVRYVIDDLSKNGRDGKGIPIVFANGNDGLGMEYWQYDESALPSVIAVGAVDNFGEHPWYSNYGEALDFVAPSGGGSVALATTDVRGSIGLADGSYGHPDYTYAIDPTGFNGTSAAAPQVSGTIALMLERDPDLTKDEIVEILKKTAKKVGDLPYDANGHNDYFGYGLVDAEAAVKEAIRLKVQREVANKSFPIDGYFIHYGAGAFDWIYVLSSLQGAYKLEGMDEDGFFQWKELSFEAIAKDGDVISLDDKEYLIDGYFVHYAKGAYDWLYVDRQSYRVFKLEGLGYNKEFLWIDTLSRASFVSENSFRFESGI